MEVTPFTHLETLATLAEPEDLSRSGTPEPEQPTTNSNHSQGSEPPGSNSNYRNTDESEPPGAPNNHIPAPGKQAEAEAAVAADAEDEQLLFGWGGCTPAALQRLVSQRTFLVVFVMTCVLQGMYYTYVVSVLTTIEKLFQFQSKTTGILFSATEIGQISGALLLTYYGGQGHRPRWIGCGITLFALCTFMYALPHFMYSDQLTSLNDVTVDADGADNSTLCRALELVSQDVNMTETVIHERDLNSSVFADMLSAQEPEGSLVPEEQCDGEQKRTAHAEIRPVVLSIFFVCLIGVGVGQTMAFNLGIPYMDDNVSSKESPMYFGE